ncbi:abasic site processing protein HMCES [Cynoglossus semilaevis]|uniref:Abasic site processing protein HMCES n=1 Tax=Cynoglossus semilaevis TaxID=244447 RepID=A0A3P8V7J6_CYNSE|nr:embryonic stem cell-specific 5-hydroxymethylcytosine-binding protein [Cynoglossus semilaevis]XP_008318541.1 embryonic stem cell-specific 5-hydroxymethylcytosine-binding protein [Cynoglossus semilaevis]XP_008318542.1 embryonic stem cell-specific 5-hydroxymethylcytosine-binding protein [Cynoglossus semilaevis]XP_024915615.1 embryonic stem cell-specific 5-hydroxymethylcytosine-binding protein [Cynoglossus semilaevis]
MCGRTACTLAPDEVRRASSYRDRRGRRRRPRWRDGDSDKYQPSYNKSPQSMSPVLLSQRHFNKEAPADKCVLALMRWGLVPAWFKENDPGKMQYNTSNCRSENIMEKKSYKFAMQKGQRCVILADGFYEWRKEENKRQPFFIYFPQTPKEKTKDHDNPAKQREEGDEACVWSGWRLLTMAGLFDCWTPPDGGEPLYSYSIITVNAAPNLQNIHHRMPAVLDGEEEVRKWLDFGEVKGLDAVKLLQSRDTLTFHPVSTLVNNTRNNNSECLQPVDLTIRKEAKPTASSKMMTSWLKSSSPSKRKRTEEEQETKTESQKKRTGLQQWLKGSDKKPRTQ